MKLSEVIHIFMQTDDMIGQTYHFRIDAEHIDRVVKSWSMITDHRPTIQLRDVKGPSTIFVVHFVLSVTIEDHQQAAWAQSLMKLTGTITHHQQ